MAGSRSQAPASRSIFTKMVFLFVVVAAVFFVFATASASPPRDDSSQVKLATGGKEMICHTDVLAECYPKVFEPTTEFQQVHEDQDLPPGLHVRLNIYTGLREAKINDPNEELPAGLAGLPVDSSVVLVDQPEQEEQQEAIIPKGAPAYDPAGVVKDPGAHAGGEGSSSAITFHESIALVKGVAVGQVGAGSGKVSLTEAEHSRFLDALVEIDDVAHDIYYGLKLAEDHAITRQLLCLMSGGSVGSDSIETRGHAAAQKASAAVAAATQNNPNALREIAKQWETYKASPCVPAGGSNATTTTLGDVIFGPYVAVAEDSKATAAWTRSRLLAINGLLKNEVVMKDFLARGGLTEILRLLVDHEGDAAYDAVRQRAANLVHDNFLDESMGADVALWPESAVVGGEPCNGNLHGHCWSHHAQQLSKAHKRDKSHWSHELVKGLQQRKASKSGKSEL
ncbi:nucleotide exchange factor sil1 [Sporothrix bragantina]|uniref:Nucleotide exchange factor sil1 n=1 Tax=Sporothrix bragantina TaxID=671064 RepID=A0ABP0AXH0_9PEZI